MINFTQFLNLAQVPIQKKDCKHAEAGALNDIDLTNFYLDEPAAKGKVNNIHVQGTMKEYQDIEKVTIKTYLGGLRLDARDAPA